VIANPKPTAEGGGATRFISSLRQFWGSWLKCTPKWDELG
jgi:hypothetical protein